jgi:hypothetical protein
VTVAAHDAQKIGGTMTRKTDQQRKAEERAKMRARGFVELTAWVPAQIKDEVRAMIRDRVAKENGDDA